MKRRIPTAQTAHLQIAQADTQSEFAKELSSLRTVGNMYSVFNEYIRQKFFPVDQTGETIIFAVDEFVINDFIAQEGVEFKMFRYEIEKELKYSWRLKAIKKDDCFGVCAIQVYIAHQMRKDGDFSSREYNPRLAIFLNIDINTLQRFYRVSQNKLWCNLKEYCEENHFKINIPLPTFGKGCYVQYPFSQTLLNQEDLKRTPILFERVGIKRTEYFPFNEFSKLIENADSGYCMSSHYYKVKERLFKDSGTYTDLYHQVFNYFTNNWDGSYLETLKTALIPRRKSIAKESANVVLDKKIQKITVFDSDYKQIEQVDINNVDLFNFIKGSHQLYDNDFLIFEKDYISEESEYVRKFETGKQYILICKKFGNASKFISSLSQFNTFSHSKYDIFAIEELSKKPKHHFWSKYFLSRSRSYKIEGGLKLGYNIWMYGAGPKVFLESDSEVWLNGKRIESCELDCSHLTIGSYKLKVDSFTPEKIEIKDITYRTQTTCRGWQISRSKNCWSNILTDFNVAGLRFGFANEIRKTCTRVWIDSLTQNRKITQYSNQVLNAIKRSNNVCAKGK